MERLDRCDNCGSLLRPDSDMIFCPYCGERINQWSKSGKKVISNKKNRHIKSGPEVVMVDDDDEDWGEKVGIVFGVIILIAFFIFFGVMVYKNHQKEIVEENIAAGMIQISFYASTFEDENYQTVKKQIEAAGFTNIELVDLNDHGFWGDKEDKVKSVSIAGDSSFGDGDWFYPDDKVIITFY